MKILHIAEIGNNLCDGMTTVVPSHVISQSQIEDVYYLNLRNIKIKGFDKQIPYLNNIGTKEFEATINQFDLVVFHGLYIWNYIRIGNILDSLLIPYVVVPHGSMTKISQKKKKCKKFIANFLFFRKFINHAAAIQYLSQGEANASLFSVKKSFVGTNGIEVSPYTISHSVNPIKQITYIGRLDVFHKGLDLLIEAVSHNKTLLIEKKIRVSIYGNDIKGRGEQVRKLIQKYEVDDIVKLNKEIFDVEKRKVLLNTDLFILTSRSEGMPMGVLEALSYGIPCLVTEGTNLSEYVNKYDAGWSCSDGAQSVSEMLHSAITEEDKLEKKSHNALELIRNVFSWTVVSQNTINYYRSLL